MSSPAGQLSTTDWKRIGIGALMALAGFAIAYLTSDVIPKIDQSNTLGMLAVAVCSILVNMGRKWLSDTQQPPTTTPPTGPVP